HADVGFDGDRVLVAEMQLPSNRNAAAVRQFADSVIDRVSQIPGADRVSVAQYTPMSENGSLAAIYFDGRPIPAGQGPQARVNAVSPGYLESLNIALVSGRTFSRQDSPDSPRGIV